MFPTSYDILGNVNVALNGNNFLHPENQVCFLFFP